MSPVIVLIVVFLASMYYSAMETAYTSFDRLLVATWLRARKFGANTVAILSAAPERFLSTTLIGNNLCNVAYSSLLVLLARASHIHELWLVTISPLFILVLAEILPKMTGYAVANRLVRLGSLPLLVSYWMMFPLRLVLFPLTRLLAGRAVPDEEVASRETFAIRRELDQILVGAEEEGAATREEGEILTRYLDARELKVRQIMTPRTELIAVPVDADPDAVRDVFRKCRHNILPVYEGDLDHVLGYVRARDFLEPRQSLRDVLRPMEAVPESKRVADLLREFRVKRRQVALVIDEYGGTDGMVTIKDIFEELVGPVAERFDPDEPVVKRLAPGKFLVSGAAPLDLIAQQTGWSPPAAESTTLSGLLSEHLGRIGELGEDIMFNDVKVRIVGRSPRLVRTCLVKLPATRQPD